MLTESGRKLRTQLWDDGFCVVKGAIEKPFLETLSSRLTKEFAPKQEEAFQTLDIPYQDQDFAKLINLKTTISVLESMGFGGIKYYSGYIINKKPGEKRRPWHQDWWYWVDTEVSKSLVPPQLGLMYYFCDTRIENGCLRVVPMSHRKRHLFHDHYRDSKYSLSVLEGEIDVPVSAGDLVIADARLLHATHENTRNENRFAITLWFAPEFYSLPSGIRARIAQSSRALTGCVDERLIATSDPGVEPVKENGETYTAFCL